MKARTIVAIILATAAVVIAAIAFAQKKRKSLCTPTIEAPECFAGDCDIYCCDDEEDEEDACCGTCACDADACTDEACDCGEAAPEAEK